MNSVQLPEPAHASNPLADIHDRVMEAYYGKLGEHFMRETQTRIHWICAQVSGSKVLDVGCSQGIVPLLLAREGCEVTGVDTSPKAIEEAKSYLAAEPAHVQANVSYVNADFLALTTLDATPDTIVISEVLEHLVRPEMFVEKAASLLKQNGRLIITVPFGVNDFIDHKHTFYLLEPLRLLNEHLNITQVKVLGKWLGMVAVKRDSVTQSAPLSLDLEQIANLESAFESIERNLQASLASASKNLADANKKYRAATEQIALLKPEAQKAEELKRKISTLETALQEHTDTRLRLDESNKKYRLSTEQNQQLKVQLSELERQQSDYQEQHEHALAELHDQHAEAQARLNTINDELHSLTTQNERLQLQATEELSGRHLAETERLNIAHLAEEQRHQHEALQAELEKDIDSLLLQIDGIQAQHEQDTLLLNTELQTYRELHLTLENQLAERNAHLERLDSDLQRQTQRLQEQTQALDEVQTKYQEATGTLVPKLKTELQQLLDQTAAQQLKIEELNDHLHRANAKQHLTEQRLIKTRASVTYQLGYQLKSSSRSMGGIIRLPGNLLKLYRQAGKNQKTSAQKSIGLDAPATPAAAPSPVANMTPAATVGNTEHVRSRLLNGGQDNAMPLKVACVMDEFTFGSYRHECNLLPLTPHDWEAELKAFQPELLFIESAWRGKDDLWGSKVGHNSQELQAIVKWCTEHKIPTVFWNKEDPVHFETFLSTAKLFDFVFTTDIDCIHRYKGALGHDRVYLLPFACQPAVHNPVELYERKDAFCFAGAYYARYPERTRDLGNFARELPTLRPLEIFDRNFGKNDVNYQFPAEYQPYIVGTLSFDEIDRAYKGYRYAINLNSIKQSQSMFARRVFELLGSNTLTVSNFSRGVRLLFGDLVITTDNGPQMLRQLKTLAEDEPYSDKLRLAALRKVMQEHTYAHRLDYVISKVTGKAQEDRLPYLCMVAEANDSAQLDALIGHLQRQHYTNLILHIVVSDDVTYNAPPQDPRLQLVTRSQLGMLTLGGLAAHARFIGAMVADDYYGPNYLLDLALATRYSQAQLLGKSAHYARDQHGISLHHASQAYRSAENLAARASLIATPMIAEQHVGDWLKSVPTLEYRHEQCLAIDAFNYCKNAAGAEEKTVSALVDDLVLDTGISIDQLQRRAESIAPLEASHTSPEICGSQLAALFEPMRSKHLKEAVEGKEWHIESTLEDGKHEYHYAKQELTVDVLGGGDKVKLFLDATPGLNLQWVVLFLDAQKQRISHVMQHANRNHTFDVPPEAAFVRLGVRVYANGSAQIKALVLGHRDLQPSEILGKAKHLLVTNHYPAYDDLYRNGFVHTRVTAYKEQGVHVDVFRLRNNESLSYNEFENIDVITGAKTTLSTLLESGTYTSVLVHFLDAQMWEVLRKHLDHIKITVWVHGAEIQPWWRREYNYSTDEQLALGKLDSEKRMSFWRELLQPMPANLKLVFVSRYFAEEVMEDLGFRIPEDHYEIIHNPINTELFSYEEKPVEQRKKILSIRPYASAKYANDLSVKAIQLLAQKPYFQEMEFLMIGDGVLFEQTLAPLEQYTNVTVQRGFLKHAQIADLHKAYGLFLCPTRMDAQGVSRDEAMASGLIPVTNGVTAIPEFVDHQCGVLAPGEDAQAMADGMARVFESPELFESMSRAARTRIEQQTAMATIIAREVDLIDKASR